MTEQSPWTVAWNTIQFRVLVMTMVMMVLIGLTFFIEGLVIDDIIGGTMTFGLFLAIAAFTWIEALDYVPDHPVKVEAPERS